jgi:hypothetical protein
MLYKQVFKTLEGAQKRVAFERAHVRDGQRGNVNCRFFVIRCRNGVPDDQRFDSKFRYDYRIEKTLADQPTAPYGL